MGSQEGITTLSTESIEPETKIQEGSTIEEAAKRKWAEAKIIAKKIALTGLLITSALATMATKDQSGAQAHLEKYLQKPALTVPNPNKEMVSTIGYKYGTVPTPSPTSETAKTDEPQPVSAASLAKDTGEIGTATLIAKLNYYEKGQPIDPKLTQDFAIVDRLAEKHKERIIPSGDTKSQQLATANDIARVVTTNENMSIQTNTWDYIEGIFNKIKNRISTSRDETQYNIEGYPAIGVRSLGELKLSQLEAGDRIVAPSHGFERVVTVAGVTDTDIFIVKEDKVSGILVYKIAKNKNPKNELIDVMYPTKPADIEYILKRPAIVLKAGMQPSTEPIQQESQEEEKEVQPTQTPVVTEEWL